MEACRRPLGAPWQAVSILRLCDRDAWHRLCPGNHRLGGEGEEHADNVHTDSEQQQRGQDQPRVHKDEEWLAQYSGAQLELAPNDHSVFQAKLRETKTPSSTGWRLDPYKERGVAGGGGSIKGSSKKKKKKSS